MFFATVDRAPGLVKYGLSEKSRIELGCLQRFELRTFCEPGCRISFVFSDAMSPQGPKRIGDEVSGGSKYFAA